MTPEATSILVAVIAALSSIVGVAFTARYAGRATRRAQEEAARTAGTKVDAEAYARARESYDAALREQERRIQRLREEARADRDEHEQDRRDLVKRVEQLERDAVQSRNRMRRVYRDLQALTAWARTLVRSLRTRGVSYDAPPIDLGDTDPDGFPPEETEVVPP